MAYLLSLEAGCLEHEALRLLSARFKQVSYQEHARNEAPRAGSPHSIFGDRLPRLQSPEGQLVEQLPILEYLSGHKQFQQFLGSTIRANIQMNNLVVSCNELLRNMVEGEFAGVDAKLEELGRLRSNDELSAERPDYASLKAASFIEAAFRARDSKLHKNTRQQLQDFARKVLAQFGR